MGSTFHFWDITARAYSSAVALYFQPLHRMAQHPSEYLTEPNKPQNRIDSLLGEGMRIVGDIDGEWKGLRVDGEWVGNINCNNGTVVISSTGSLEGDLHTAFVVINGRVKGNINASCAVYIEAKAQVEGSVCAPVVEINLDAMVRGAIDTTETIGSPKFNELRGKVREIANESIKLYRVK